jgi:hypothetical protein
MTALVAAVACLGLFEVFFGVVFWGWSNCLVALAMVVGVGGNKFVCSDLATG